MFNKKRGMTNNDSHSLLQSPGWKIFFKRKQEDAKQNCGFITFIWKSQVWILLIVDGGIINKTTNLTSHNSSCYYRLSTHIAVFYHDVVVLPTCQINLAVLGSTEIMAKTTT